MSLKSLLQRVLDDDSSDNLPADLKTDIEYALREVPYNRSPYRLVKPDEVRAVRIGGGFNPSNPDPYLDLTDEQRDFVVRLVNKHLDGERPVKGGRLGFRSTPPPGLTGRKANYHVEYEGAVVFIF